ncbi:undecaprenyl-diphosphatase [Streptomyces sp. yr375]|uniref:phosphatase PAP2 family protein n=1 Tax=Streptomyces sp. yr375 TaxID=1761906 RepID=UPI0008CF51B4|nr:phosphatase PAP2 family protein [Streptomyces sp. yr375]SES06835.1 undecaprenyl-diphosphatase [Streptomyces sp. yr375]
MPPRPTRAFLFPLLALPALLFVLITWQVAVDGPLLRMDQRLSSALVHPDRASELLADLGDVQVAVPVLLLVAGYAAWRGRAAGGTRWWVPSAAALGLMILVPLIVVPLKEWTDRPGTPAVPPATGYYPSGHTATAAVAYGSAVLILLPWLRTAYARRTAVATAALLVLAVSYGLVRRGYHWPLDVMASWCLCTVLLGALRLSLNRLRTDAGRPRQTGAPPPPTRTTRTSDPSASRPYRGARKPQDTP